MRMEINYWEMLKNLLPILWNFWPIWLFVILILIFKFIINIVIPDLISIFRFKKGFKWRKDRELLIWLRGLSPKEFEEYISDLFLKMGYDTKVVGGSYDGGIDVIAEKNGIKHYIQCKKYFQSHKVGPGEVREFYGAIAHKLASGKGYFITTNIFTLAAERFAEDKPIELIDGYKLVEYIESVGGNIETENSENKVIGNNIEEDSCPKCRDGKLVERSGKFGKFYGCSNYPRCRYIKEINSHG